MASEVETWWADHYTAFSLQQLDSWEIFRKFRSFDEDFDREEQGTGRESFHRSEEAAAYCRESAQLVETLVHYPEAYTWMYERRAHGTAWTTWKNPYAEWGLVVEERGNGSEKQSWKIESGARVHEQVTLQDGVKTTHRSGITQSAGLETESWSETHTESPEETKLERKWRQPGSSGSEVRGKAGTKSYGECSFRSAASSEKKQWSVEAGRERGTCTGFNGKKQFSHRWDFSEDCVWEERVQQEGKRSWGARKKVVGEKWLREEWEGLQPADSAISPLCTELLDASEATLKAMAGQANVPKIQHFLASRHTLADTPPDTAIESALQLALQYEALKADLACETGSRALTASIEDLLAVHRDLLRQLLASPSADSALSDSSQRVDSQIEALLADSDYEGLSKASELVRLIKDQTRLIQVLTRKLLNHESETKRVLKQLQSHFEFSLSNALDDSPESLDFQQNLEEIRNMSRISDLLQLLPRLLPSPKSPSPPSDPFLEELRSLMVNLESRALEVASILGVEEETSALLSPASSAYHDLYRRGNAVLQLLWKVTSQAEIVQISVTATTEEVTTNMSVAMQKKDEKVAELAEVVELRTRVITELNQELDELRNVHRHLKEAEESLAVCRVEKAKEARRAEVAELQLAALKRPQTGTSLDSQS